jgi:hypothetical protein
MKTTNRTITGMAITAPLLLNFFLLSAAIRQCPAQHKNIVLVHGAFVEPKQEINTSSIININKMKDWQLPILQNRIAG